MTLLEQQQLFSMLIADLITHAYSAGYAVTLGEAYRTPQQARWDADRNIGIAHSLHTERLAIDLNLFKGATFLTAVEDYRPLGDYWTSLHDQARWGGNFRDVHGNSKPDADHFSLAWDGTE